MDKPDKSKLECAVDLVAPWFLFGSVLFLAQRIVPAFFR